MAAVRRFAGTALLLALVLLTPRVALAALSAEDLAWIDRVTYGVNKQTTKEYEKLGREKFLQKQLHPPANDQLDEATEANLARNVVDMQTALADVTV